MLRVNIGCGRSPTPGWVNIDNSPSVLLRSLPVGHLLGETRREVWRAARAHSVRYGSARRLPFPAGSADVVYSSHMIEHLSRKNVIRFLRECYRILAPEGILRIVIPDLNVFVADYLLNRDADRFIERLMLVRRTSRCRADLKIRRSPLDVRRGIDEAVLSSGRIQRSYRCFSRYNHDPRLRRA